MAGAAGAAGVGGAATGTALVVGEPPVFGLADLRTTVGTMGGGVTEAGGGDLYIESL